MELKHIVIVLIAAVISIWAGCKRQVPPTFEPDQNNGADRQTIEQPVETPPAAPEAQRQEETDEQTQSAAGTEAKPDTVQYSGMTWYTDLETAKKNAAEQNKQILINFSGSDWCYWCQRLDEEVFSKRAFQEAAGKHFVFLLVDFPAEESKISAEQKRKNQQLLSYYGVQGFPTILLARSSTGKAYALTGYQEGGPQAYMKHLLELKQEDPAGGR